MTMAERTISTGGPRTLRLGLVVVGILALLLPSHVALGANSPVERDGSAGTFTEAQALPNATNGHASIGLDDGRLLVVGGSEMPANVWVWQPAATAWSVVEPLAEGRIGPSANRLLDGSVLVTGGFDEDNMAVSSAEVWDPATSSSSVVGSTLEARAGHSATTLADGRVLLAGGIAVDPESKGQTSLASAELWRPGTRSFERTGSLAAARVGHTATLMPDGRVIVVGGLAIKMDDVGGPDMKVDLSWPLGVEIWDPSTGTFASLGTMPGSLVNHTATPTSDGRVLIVGGVTGDGSDISDAVLSLDTVSGFVQVEGYLLTPRARHTTTLLSDGSLLIVGGEGEAGTLASAELWLQASAMAVDAGTLATARSDHTATSLPDGDVVIIGGFSGTEAMASTEIWRRANLEE